MECKEEIRMSGKIRQDSRLQICSRADDERNLFYVWGEPETHKPETVTSEALPGLRLKRIKL